MYLILNKLNQGCVELNFFVQRKMCRGTTDITAYMYGYNISSQLVSKKQAHQAFFFFFFFFFRVGSFFIALQGDNGTNEMLLYVLAANFNSNWNHITKI